jgi:hypothetical protein
MPTADIKGPQRTVLGFEVKPVKPSQGEAGIPLRGGRTLPFTVLRQWIAPAGRYAERFYLVDKESREIIWEGPERLQSAWGLQGATEETTIVEDSFALDAGTYLIVFALGGVSGGEFDVEAFEVPA